MSEKPHLERRDFVKVVLSGLGGLMGVTIGIPALGYLISPAMKTQASDSWISLGSLANYPIGLPTLFNFTRTTVNGWDKTVNSYGAYVVRSSETQVAVLSTLCTHLSCRVKWDQEKQSYVCPCHDAQFSVDGRVTSGPPPAPLHAYETKVEEGNLFIHFVES